MDDISSLKLPEVTRVRGEMLGGGAEVIDRLAPEWRALCLEGPCGAPFYQPEWFAAYVRAFNPQAEVLLVTARSDGRLIGVLPLVRSIGSYSGIAARKLMSAGNSHTCRYDLVHGSGRIDPVPAIWKALTAIRGWDVLELNDVVRSGMAARLARHASAQGYGVTNLRASTSPYVRLDDGTVFDRLHSKFRGNLRRRMARLEERGAVRLVLSREIDRQLAAFYALEALDWKGAERSAIACDPATRNFYDNIAADLAEKGCLALYSLKCGDADAAIFFGMWHGSCYYLLKTAFDPLFRQCSPGQLITQEVLRELAADGCSEFDFLGEMMDWKRDWQPRLRGHANWYVFRGPLGQTIHRTHGGIRRSLGRTYRRLRSRV